VTLSVEKDLTFTDALYRNTYWSGLLATAGDLTLKAARIYPTTLTAFSVGAGGKVTILPSGSPTDGIIYSAGGSLAIQAGGGIEQRGYLAAPMGSLTLGAPGKRVYLAEGSVTTTRGSAGVMYGEIAATLGEDIWGTLDRTSTTRSYRTVSSAPDESVSITAGEVIVRDGATIDVSGGGSIFTYQWLKSYQGSTNPLAGTYVILPDNSITLPGKAVYLSGIPGLPAGTYSLLPAEGYGYAFLPGAIIITDLGAASTIQGKTTSEGYSIVTGYATTMGTGARSSQLEAYQARSAASVLQEGDFGTQSFTAGNAGRVSLSGTTTILGGTILASPLAGYRGGSIVLSSTEGVYVQESGISLPSGFDFSTPVPAGLSGNLTIAASSLSGKGFGTIGLGYTDDPGMPTARTLTVREGAVLQAENIILAARDLITLESGARILALASSGNTGQASLYTPAGRAVIEPGVLVHATDAITLNTNTLVLGGTLFADHSTLNLVGSRITVSSGGSSGAGINLTESQWNTLGDIFSNLTRSAHRASSLPTA
jgi:hypothetical protein